jgi:hypothetical protein
MPIFDDEGIHQPVRIGITKDFQARKGLDVNIIVEGFNGITHKFFS